MPISKDGKTKICSKCKQLKSIDDFTNRRKNADGKTSECRECRATYRLENKSKINETKRKYYKSYLLNDRVRETINIRSRLRTFIYSIRDNKNVHSIKHLGCNKEEFIEHINTSAKEHGYTNFDFMTYNMSRYHIDHIIPLKSYIDGDISIEDVSVYTNIQILEAEDNLLKGERV